MVLHVYAASEDDFPHTQFVKMRYVAAYLLARLGGNDNPDASDIKKILESVGAEVDEGKLQHVVSELRGKDIDEVGHILTNFNLSGA